MILQVFSDLIPVSMELNKACYKTFSDTVPSGSYDASEVSMAPARRPLNMHLAPSNPVMRRLICRNGPHWWRPFS